MNDNRAFKNKSIYIPAFKYELIQIAVFFLLEVFFRQLISLLYTSVLNKTYCGLFDLTARSCVHGYYLGLCICSLLINPFILTSEAMPLYETVSGPIITFYLILTSSGRN